MSKLEQHREVWPNQSDEWLFERLTRELSQKVETIHGLLDEKTQLQKDKAELLEALEKAKNELLQFKSAFGQGSGLIPEIETLIQKYKQ